MEYTYLGNSNIKVSKLCLGCMSFGDNTTGFHDWTVDQQQTDIIVKKALDLGINFFDTANSYSMGTSEIYLGNALKKYAKREDVVIASKVYFNEGHLSKEAIHREIDLTLERLQTDYLDLYIIHRFDASTKMEETMEALHQLVVSGKVRALGASAMYGYQFHNLQEIAIKNNWTPFVSMQNHYNAIYREDERELIPVCKQYNVSLTPYSVLASGRLSRTEWHTETLRSQSDKVASRKYDSTEKQDQAIAARINELALKKNCTMTQIALAWHFAKGVSSPVIGVTKEKYLEDAVKCFDIKLNEEEVNYIDELYVPHKISGAI